MIREFFAPRLALFFFLFAALVWAGLYVWMMASNKPHRRWLTHARIPFVALGISVGTHRGVGVCNPVSH